MLTDHLITEDIRARANLEAAQELMRWNTSEPITSLEFDIVRQVFRTNTGHLISAEVLYEFSNPIARRMATQETPIIGPKLHAADVRREVAENPTGKSISELIDDAQAAVEARDKDGAMRAIAELFTTETVT